MDHVFDDATLFGARDVQEEGSQHLLGGLVLLLNDVGDSASSYVWEARLEQMK